ncbi:hypothetical protein FHO69_22600 [Vibrio vulnificus]|nr:hypothetical protein [Vibrio vulnificus]
MEKLRLTRRLRRIHNAWRFQFKLSLVFKVQWFKFGGWRCSPLNAALYASNQKVDSRDDLVSKSA